MKKIFLIVFLLGAVVFLSFYFNGASEYFFRILREKTYFAQSSMIFFTTLGMFFIGGVILMLLALKKRYKIIILSLIAIFSALVIGYILKMIFHVPRPEFDVYGPILARGYSFPSMHTIGAIAVFPFISRITKNRLLQILFALFLAAIPVSRLYLGVHRLSDVVVGAILGVFIGIYAIALEKEYKFAEKIVNAIKTELEVRRQLAHLLAGLLIALFVFYNFFNTISFAVILAFGVGVSAFLRYVKIPFIHQIQCLFDRQCDMKKIPGKGLVFMFAGSFLAYLMYPKNIAVAAILILGIGDSLTHIIGRYFGGIKSPFDKTKNIEGTVVAFFITALGVIKFVSFYQALAGTIIAMAIEMVPIKIWKIRIDDNLIIPLLAGAMMNLI